MSTIPQRFWQIASEMLGATTPAELDPTPDAMTQLLVCARDGDTDGLKVKFTYNCARGTPTPTYVPYSENCPIFSLQE
jgi:hypothetical protein